MELEDGIRRCFVPFQEPGYKAPSPLYSHFVWETMSTEGRSGLSSKIYLNPQSLPHMIDLRVRLKPHVPNRGGIYAQVIKEGQRYQPTLFYQPITGDETSHTLAQHAVQSIDFIFEGHGFWHIGEKKNFFRGLKIEGYQIEWNHSSCVHHHSYQIQSVPLIRQTQTDVGEYYLFHLTGWPQGLLNTVGLLPYGGYYDPRLHLDQISQTYVKLSTTQRTHTKLIIKTLPQWDALGIRPFESNLYRGRIHIFPDPPDTVGSLSLAGVIQKGHIRFRLTSESHIIEFRSIRYRQNRLAGGSIDLIFLPSQETWK